MHSLPNMKTLEQLLDQPINPTLRKLLADRLSDTRHCGLEEYTHVLVIEEGDEEAAIVAAIGFSPLLSRIDGIPDQPDWDWIERHEGGWYEVLYCVSNSGFAYILLVEDEGSSPIVALCREHCP